MRTRNLMNLDSGCVLRFGQFPSIYSQLYSTCAHARQTPIMFIISTHVNVDSSLVNLAGARHLQRVRFLPAFRLLVTGSDLA